MRISASQIKTFTGSKSKRAWRYILWIKDDIENDAFLVGTAYENWILTGDDRVKEVIKQSEQKVKDMEKLLEDLEIAKFNSKGLEFERWKFQVEISWTLFGVDFVGYIDNLTDERIDDIKTCKYPSKEDWWKNMWSNITTREEYELQLRMYMKALNRDKARIIEVSKHKYKDWKPRNQIIEYKMTDEFDLYMTWKWKPVIMEMIDLYNKYK